MIKNQWYAILDSREVVGNKVTMVERLGYKLALWRDVKSDVHCIYDVCCHRGASLSLGKIVDNHLECPFHGFLYNGSGEVTLIPANGKAAKVPDEFKVNSYIVKEKAGLIFMWYGDSEKVSTNIDFFNELEDGFGYSTLKDVWDVHYSRAIENQLDAVHVPFVHKTTIGAGGKTIINGPVVIRVDKLLRMYVDTAKDDGYTVNKTQDQIENYEDLFQLQFLYPNLWQNIISKKVRVFAAFAPINDEKTMIYIRFYQKITTIPLLNSFILLLGKIFSKIILNQDKRVVISQVPKKSQLYMQEKLIHGDIPIIEYRKYREELKNTIE